MESYINITKYSPSNSQFGVNKFFCEFHNATLSVIATASFKIILSIGTVFGNSLVIAAVATDSRLRTAATNLFIVSLAMADLLMGLIVMPFSTINELGPSSWLFGDIWCDAWRATDVLSSTASILSLTLIAAERHHVTTGSVMAHHPTSHRFSPTVSLVMVLVVWILSICISYPAIVWWRLSKFSNHSIISDLQSVWCVCTFTSDPYYILVSSCVSFYLPLAVMLILYARIYRTAKSTLRCLKRGEKIIENPNNGDSSSKIVLRIHRGGGGGGNGKYVKANSSNSSQSGGLSQLIAKQKSKSISQPLSGMVDICSGPVTSSSTIGHKLRHCAITKKITKFNTEQKAAKTLGFVMGTFILCWLPFFICNVIVALDTSKMILPPQSLVLPIVTWLGYLNSCINPVIYAHSMRNFRFAFIKLLCPGYYRRKLNRSYTLSTRANYN